MRSESPGGSGKMTADDFVQKFKTDQNYRRWFKRWWREDYSVSGCAEKSIRVSSFSSTFAGREWPAGRVPPHDISGQVNPQFAWYNFASHNQNYIGSYFADARGVFIHSTREIADHVQNADLRSSFVNSRVGPNRNQGRPRLGGAYLNDGVSSDNLSGTIHLEGATINGGIEWTDDNRNTLIQADKSIITGDITLSQSVSISLDSSTIAGRVSCSGHISAVSATLAELNISHTHNRAFFADLRSCNVKQRISIHSNGEEGVINAGDLITDDISLSGKFKSADLSRSCLSSLTLNNVNARAILLTQSDINRIQGDSCHIDSFDLSNSIVRSDISLPFLRCSSANFSNLAVAGRTSLSSLLAEDELSCSSSVFSGVADFSGASFPGTVDCSHTVFLEGLNLRAGRARNRTPSDDGQTLGRANFQATIFKKNNLGICADFDRRLTRDSATFEGALFYGLAQFYECTLHEDVSFREADFVIAEAAPTFGSRFAEGLSAISHYRAQLSNPQGVGSTRSRIPKAWLSALTLARPSSLVDLYSVYMAAVRARRSVRNQQMERYERSYGALKQKAADIGNTKYERFFHTLELRARRRRRGDRDAPFLDNLASGVYDMASEYGQSIGRPIIILFVVLFPIFSGLYFLFAGVWSMDAAGEALTFSARQIVKPFSVWGREFSEGAIPGSSSNWIGLLIGGDEASSFRALAVRLIASVESIAAIMLIFLTGLAVKRSFSVS